MGLFNFFRNLRLGVKLNLVVVLAFGLLLAATVAIISDSIQGLILHTGQRQAEQEAAVVQARFGEAEQTLLASAKLLASAPGLAEAVASGDVNGVRTAALVGAAPLNLDDVDVVDATGARLNDFSEGTEGDEDALMSLALLGIEATGMLFEEVEGESLLWLAAVAPIFDLSGQIVGGVIVSRQVDDEFMDEINFFRDNPHLALLVTGEALTDNQWHPEEGEDFVPDKTAVGRALAGQTVISDNPSSIAGVLHTVAYTPLTAGDQTKAVIAIVNDLGALTIFQDQVVNRLIILIGLLALSTIGVMILFVRQSISMPIRLLAKASEEMAEGDWDASLPVTGNDEIGRLASNFRQMAAQLHNLVDSLEERIWQRTQALETSAEISSQLIAIRDLDELFRYIVNRIQTEFGFYHTHIYLIEEETGDLVMVEGSGEVGRQLKEKGHRLEAGQGIVGTVARTNDAFLSNNVADLLNFVRNPLLPDTRSELAVPLRKGDQVLGVLDIQSEEINRFAPADQSLMQSIANQTAIAIDNARLLAETQAALQQVERLNVQLTGEGWEKFTEELPAVGYRYRDGVSIPLMPDSNGWLRPMKQAAVSKQLVKEVHPGNGQPPRAELAVPLMLRGQLIGTLGIKREEAADWSDDEMMAIESVANQITLALENARLSKEQQKTIVQLKDVDRLKSEFLTSMSHELRTPLNSIIGFADVILQGIDGDIPEMAMNDIRLIHNSGQHLLALINDILDLSKIEASKMELVREPLDISDVFKKVLSASTSLVKNKPVEIIVEANETLPPVYADKLRFNQIMLNLVSNAVKFTDEGRVTLRAKVQEHAPDQMFISVTDTGIGIPPDKIDAVFDRFRQADDSVTTRKYGGTGLGLPICKQLVEMHGGELGLTSEEGQGSTFFFTMPLAAETVTVEN